MGKQYEYYPVKAMYISSEARFYSVKDIQEMTGWSHTTVEKLFSDPKFPSSNFGKKQVIEAHALIEYFSVKHEKERDRFWRVK